MPNIDEQLEERLRRSAPRPAGTDDVFGRLSARKHQRRVGKKVGTTALIACVLLGTAAGFLVLGRAFRTTSSPVATPSQPIENLGLGYPICRVMSMPITVGGVDSHAYVFTREEGDCPKAGEGDRFVAADLNDDGVVDTAPVQLHGCFPPIGCEALATPDLNEDGTSEIAVSNAGADGYGVWLFALSTSPPAIAQITVVDPQGIGYIQTGPIEFAWADVVGHAEGAACESLPNGRAFAVYSVDKLLPKADVRRTTLRLDGSTATVIGASRDDVPLSEAPAPGNELCGSPLYGTAGGVPEATRSDQMDIGIGEPLCDVSTVTADFTGDGQDDTAFVGMEGRGGRCSNAAEGTEIIAMDVTGDGQPDGGYFVNGDCLLCAAHAAADLDGNGIPELVVSHQSSATPEYELIEPVVGATPEDLRLVPIVITTDAPQMGLSDGQPVSLTAGGDEGSSSAITCEGSSAGPVLIQWSSREAVDGTGSGLRDIDETKLAVAGTHATIVDSHHTTQSTSDPLPFDPLDSSGCGVQWFSQ